MSIIKQIGTIMHNNKAHYKPNGLLREVGKDAISPSNLFCYQALRAKLSSSLRTTSIIGILNVSKLIHEMVCVRIIGSKHPRR